MTQKELRHLSRSDLLEMLLELSRENEKLAREASALRRELGERNIAIDQCGSLAEAALKLNGVFEAAQAACDEYTRNIQQRHEQLEEHCRKMEQETREKCDAMLAAAQEEHDSITDAARKACDEMTAAAREKCDTMMATARENARQCIAQAREEARNCLNEAKTKRSQEDNAYAWVAELMNDGDKK